MARKKHISNRSRRVATANTNRRLPTSPMSPRPYQIDLIDYLQQIEDRRQFHPEGVTAPAQSLNSSRHRLYLPTPTVVGTSVKNPYAAMPGYVAFQHPKNVLVCVRRKIRKEVLHAYNKTGKTGQKPPRRSEYSNIQC